MSEHSIVDEEVISTERLVALELRRLVARDADDLTEQASELLTSIGGTGLTNTQINSLLAIANTTDTVADVIRFLERQASRQERWQKYAEQLIKKIRGDLSDNAVNLAEDVQKRLSRRSSPELEALTEKRGRLPEVHLLLVREFIQSFGIGYLYKFAKEN